MSRLAEAKIAIAHGEPLSLEQRTAITCELQKVKNLEGQLSTVMEELKLAAIAMGQLNEKLTKLINNQSVLATIGTNSLLACGRDEDA